MCNHSNEPGGREGAMVVTHRDDTNKPTVWCDPCLEPLIRVLNDNGFDTVASCCGHGHRPGRIVLADGRELFLVPNFDAARALDDLYPIDINGDGPEERAAYLAKLQAAE